MQLKDIILKKGDIIYFENGDRRIQLDDMDYKVGQMSPNFFSINDIIKIERPHYEIIYEAPKEILDKKEKEYLENFLRPFKEQLVCIVKTEFLFPEEVREFCYLRICYKDTKNRNEYICLPNFKSGTMYKGMKLDKGYTLEELGLFKE